jgi:hypothetical protein
VTSVPDVSLEDTKGKLVSARGIDFERAVRDAIELLWLNGIHESGEEATSDVVAEAQQAVNPYFAVIECNAVDEASEVGYEKLGQLRGNFQSYMDSRRQTLFKRAYKILVGKPRFSQNTKDRSVPDVCLLSVEILVELLNLHAKYHFAQDEIETVFKAIGEIGSEHLKNLVEWHRKKLAICALVVISLLDDYALDRERRKPFTQQMQVVGSVLAYAKLLRIEGVSEAEVFDALRDMSGPFFRLISINGAEVRLASVPLNRMPELAQPLGMELKTLIDSYTARLAEFRRASSAARSV